MSDIRREHGDERTYGLQEDADVEPDSDPGAGRSAPPDATSRSFGTWLRRQREGRGIALREIADSSKISIRYLQAFEEDRFDLLPAGVFARGFLRQYARYVGLEPEDVVNYYLVTIQPQEDEGEDDEAVVRRRRSATSPWVYAVAFGVASVVLLGLVALLYALGQRQPPPPPQSVIATAPPPATGSEAAPPAEPPAAVAELPGPPLRVTLDFADECWVEARIDGTRRIAELHVQGESLRLDAQQQVELTLGDAGAVEVEVNGHPYDLARGAGQVARGVRIDLETARRLAGENAG